MANRKKLIHIKSSQTVELPESGVVAPKLPNSEQIEYGEISINYADGYETMAIRNANDDIVTFSNDNTILNYVDDAISANTKDEVTIVYSGETEPPSGSTYEIFIDENVETEAVDVYTQEEVDDKISAATEDAKSIIQVLEPSANHFSSDIIIDENVDPAEVEVYTQEQTNNQIDSALSEAIKVDAVQGFIQIDTTQDLEVEFYTKAQVDSMCAALEARIKALEDKA